MRIAEVELLQRLGQDACSAAADWAEEVFAAEVDDIVALLQPFEGGMPQLQWDGWRGISTDTDAGGESLATLAAAHPHVELLSVIVRILSAI